MQTEHAGIPSAEEALLRLIEGNRRFREGKETTSIRAWSPRLAIVEQRPFAVILGCSDSRTPVEILFDQGFGDLFVVRVAGNIVAPSVVGSIEFAVSQFGPRLVVVMGHTRCGAITATVKALKSGPSSESNSIKSITERIAPHIQGLLGSEAGHEIREAERANVRASASHLRHGSQMIEELVLAGQVTVVGAEYDIDTGSVLFFDGVPLTSAALQR